MRASPQIRVMAPDLANSFRHTGWPSIRAAFCTLVRWIFTAWPNLYPQRPIPDRLRSLQTFEKITAIGV